MFLLAALRLRWSLYVLMSVIFAVSGYWYLQVHWELQYALRWLGLTSLTLVYVWLVFWRALIENHRKNDPVLLPTLGIGNIFTLLRGICVAGLAGFLFSPWPDGVTAWFPAGLYFLACISDFLDGALARLTNHATRLGEILDMEYDSLGVLVSVLLVVFYGQAPGWFILIALARYLFLTGLWLRKRRGLPVYDLPQSTRRRVLAGFLMGLLAFLLVPVFDPPGTLWIASAFGIPMLAGFIWDWMAVSGAVSPSPKRAELEVRLARWSAFGLRLLAIGLFMIISLDSPSPSQVSNGLRLAAWIVFCLLTLGVMGRVAAFLGLMILGIHQIVYDLNLPQLLLGMVLTGLLILGTGPFSLWAPEDRLVLRRIGEARSEAG